MSNEKEFFYDQDGQPHRYSDVDGGERFVDFEEVFPERARRLLARAGLRLDGMEGVDHIYIVRPTKPEEYAQGIRTNTVVEVRRLFERG
ncbi:MAG TPA: hypothetical protein VFH06_05285 [Candidatus Saccharimonadales bacterium]|nr:hypothetical protein [Candidatus Saccharimonadales bacterium]